MEKVHHLGWDGDKFVLWESGKEVTRINRADALEMIGTIAHVLHERERPSTDAKGSR